MGPDANGDRRDPCRREIKSWGIATSVFTNKDTHVSVAEILSGGKSSVHRHIKFDNILCVISGQIRVDTDKDRYFLSRGESVRIPSGLLHSFFAEQDSVVAEVYVPPGTMGGAEFKDIHRVIGPSEGN